MKKRQKRLASLLLTCVMVCTPVSQALAETAYEASAGVSGQLLFPQDSLMNVPLAVAVDGQEAVLEEGGIWKNTDEDKVYSAQTDENGVIQLTQEGYVLVVEGGVSEKNNTEEETPDHHYQFREEEKPETVMDIASYEQGETVKLKADEPEEGMVFAGWTSDTEGVSFADASAAETILTMLDKKVVVKATYESAAAETEQPVESESEVVDIPAESETPAASSENPADGEDITVEVIGGDAETPVDTAAPAPEAEPVLHNLYINDGTESGSYAAGSPVTVVANDYTADGYQFIGWRVDYENVVLDDASSEITTFIMPEQEVVLSAQYTEIVQEPTAYTVTVNDGTVENGTNSGSYEAEAWVMITANDRSAEGLEFNGWFVDSMNVELEDLTSASTGFTMPASAVTVSAQYKTAETEAPAAEAPVTEAPVTEAPAAEVPATEAPTPETEMPTESTLETLPAGTDSEPVQIETAAPTESEAVQTEPQVQTYELVVENGIGSGEYSAGTIVTVEAPEEDGQTFEGWATDNTDLGIADASQEVVSFTMPAESVVITAEYNAEPSTAQYELIVTNGTAEAASYPKDAEVTVTATNMADKGLVVTGWSAKVSDASGTASDLDLSAAQVSEDKMTIKFAMPEGKVEIAPVYGQDPNAFKITISNGLINGSLTEAILQKDTSFTITPNAAPYGQEFANWTINDGTYDLGDAAYNANLTLTATENMTILANYDGIEYAVTVNDGFSDYEECVVGTVVSITADEAPEGYEFDYWTVDTENASLADAYSEITTFEMPDGEVTVTAHYKQVEFKVTVENGYADEGYYYAGETVTIYSNYPASGRVFDQWTSISGNVSTFKDASRWKTTFVMPASDVTVKAAYKNGPSTDNNQILDLAAGGEYITGQTITFTASGAGMNNSNPNPGDYRYRPSGYQIGNVTGTWQASPYTTSMAIRATGEYTLKVIFNKDVFDGNNWVSDGTSDAKSVTFRVITEAESVATGDDTPIILVIALAAVSCVVFIVLLILFLKKKRR